MVQWSGTYGKSVFTRCRQRFAEQLDGGSVEFTKTFGNVESGSFRITLHILRMFVRVLPSVASHRANAHVLELYFKLLTFDISKIGILHVHDFILNKLVSTLKN